MVTFGLDISHHQGTSLDLAQCRREGVEFIFLKATEGSSFVDSAFAANLNKARAAGMLVAAYHYVRDNATASAQALNILRVVPLDVPVILDVEANSGGIQLTRNIISDLRGAGYKVPLLYLPRWYWQQIGSPSLAGLPPLWSSRYPDNVVGSLADEYNRAPASYWTGYGGLGVTVLQFTSSARVAGHQPLDGNAFIGTREQLAAVLGQEDDDMQPTDLVIDPATGAPALDINGKTYTYNQAWYYTNLSGWEIREQNTRIEVKLDALAGALSDDEANVIAAVRQVVTPTIELKPGDVDRFAQTILAQLPATVQESIRQAFARAGQTEEAPNV